MDFRRTLITVGLGALAGLALTGAAAPQVVGKTVVTGTVMLNPAAPVCYPGEPCSKPARGFTLEFSQRAPVRRVKTNDQGRYRVLLRPGIYRVSSPGGKAVGNGLIPKRIKVPGQARATRNFTYDAGIR
jgi:hypothetical protein